MADGTTSPERRLVISRQTHQGQYFTELLDDTTQLDMMLIPGGEFVMGSPPDELDSNENEQPQHQVRVSPFFMGRTPVTQAQWRVVAEYERIDKYLDPDPSRFKGDNRPVEYISWDNATEFYQRLSKKTGRTYRLPSEAEWEYACRAGTRTPFCFGETISDELANYCAQATGWEGGSGTYGRGVLGTYREETTEVGIFPANNFGLYDMHGNVWEWCEDDWHDNYTNAPEDGSAWIEANRTETSRVLRGGSWSDVPKNCRSAVRGNPAHDFVLNYVGFRVCCVPPRTLFSA